MTISVTVIIKVSIHSTERPWDKVRNGSRKKSPRPNGEGTMELEREDQIRELQNSHKRTKEMELWVMGDSGKEHGEGETLAKGEF